MSSFVYMKVLESAPWRYDRGIRWLSGGHIDALYGRIAELVAEPERRVLDIGCGTGGLTLACAARGADVVGLDSNAEMLAVARNKPVPIAGHITWVELGAAEIEDRFEADSFDAVVSSLAFSEMSPDERRYTLAVARTRLCPGGLLVVADEVWPPTRAARIWHGLRRAPLAAWTWLVTQTSTRSIEDLAELVRDAGFIDIREERPWSSDLAIVAGVRPKEAA